MTKRETAIEKARVYGYNNDKASFTRLWVESKVKLELLNESFRLGQKQKERGYIL